MSKLKTIVVDGVEYRPCKDETLSGYSIIRADSGVYFGKLESIDKTTAVIAECRQLWYWKTNGLNCLEIALHGLEDGSKVSNTFHRVTVFDVRAHIECNETAARSVREYPAWKK